jgi:hypothetical protein
MRKQICFALVFAFAAVVVAAPSLLAKDSPLNLTVTGPVVATHGKTLTLAATGANNQWGSDGTIATATTVDFYQIQAAVINPWTGKVVVDLVGTNAVTVNQVLTGPYLDTNGNYVAGQSYTESFSMTLPVSTGSGQTLIAVIYAMDKNSNVIGQAIYGFITN